MYNSEFSNVHNQTNNWENLNTLWMCSLEACRASWWKSSTTKEFYETMKISMLLYAMYTKNLKRCSSIVFVPYRLYDASKSPEFATLSDISVFIVGLIVNFLFRVRSQWMLFIKHKTFSKCGFTIQLNVFREWVCSRYCKQNLNEFWEDNVGMHAWWNLDK